MPKTVMRLYLGEEHDKEAQEYLKRTIEFEEMAARAATPSDRERYGDKARLERSLAIEALEQAAIASGSELRELIRETRNSSRLLAFLHLIEQAPCGRAFRHVGAGAYIPRHMRHTLSAMEVPSEDTWYQDANPDQERPFLPPTFPRQREQGELLHVIDVPQRKERLIVAPSRRCVNFTS